MRFAQFISVVGHPLFMPVYAMVLIFEFNPYIYLQVPNSIQAIVLTILSVFTILLPLITAIVLQKLGVVKSIYMKTAEERKWPFLLSVLWYYLGFEILTNLALPISLYLLMIGAITVILIAYFITLRWKISVHRLPIAIFCSFDRNKFLHLRFLHKDYQIFWISLINQAGHRQTKKAKIPGQKPTFVLRRKTLLIH